MKALLNSLLTCLMMPMATNFWMVVIFLLSRTAQIKSSLEMYSPEFMHRPPSEGAR